MKKQPEQRRAQTFEMACPECNGTGWRHAVVMNDDFPILTKCKNAECKGGKVVRLERRKSNLERK
jgi:hypothetical protein